VRPRDELEDEDQIRLTLDTFADRRRAYIFGINARGVQADGVLTEGADEDLTWDGIFSSAGALHEGGYVVEVAIPLKTLRFRAERRLQWGVHIERFIPRRNELISWAPQDRAVSGYLLQAGRVELQRESERARVLDIIPSSVGLTQWERGDAAPNRFYKADPGITVNYSLTPNLTLSAAVNPDFSQVETDIPLADVNQRFELFFPERRPFFLEGGEVFRPLQQNGAATNLVNTRRIIDPDFGVKLTGKLGRYNVGYLAAADRAPRIFGEAGSLAARQDAQFHIARVQRDLGRDSAVGGIFTFRSHAGSSNTVAGGDFRLRLTRGLLLFGQHVASRTVSNPAGFLAGNANLPKESRNGQSHVLRLSYESSKWFSATSLRDLTSGFQPEAGFIRRNGITGFFQILQYRIRPEKSSRRFVEISPQLYVSALRTRAGKLDETFIDPTFYYEFPRAISGELFLSNNREHFAGRDLNYRFFASTGSIAPWKRWALGWETAFGGGAFYDDLQPQTGRGGVRTSATLTLRPNARLSSEIRHIHSSLRSRFSDQTLFVQNIWRERTVFQFNRFWSIRSITEFNANRRRIGFSELLTWLPSPNTAFYLGYSDLLSNPVGFGRMTREAEDLPMGWQRQRQVYFMKLTWNFRL
jgi:hypothetical protein